MKRKTTWILAIAASLILLSTSLIFAQESQAPAQQMPPAPAEASLVSVPADLQIQWLYGEVVSVDLANKIIVVKYLDYETDQEKEATMQVDDKTVFEDVGSLAQIQPKDALSIDYIIESDGRNLVKNISVEDSQNSEGAGGPENIPAVP